MTRTELPWPAPGACGARVPATCAPLQRLPRASASCNWRGLVQRVQWRYRACGPGPGGAGSGSWRRKPCARYGARGLRRSGPPLPRVPLPGVTRPGRAREGSKRAGAPSNLRGLTVVKFQVNRWQTRVERGDLRRPISCPVLPGYTRAYGVPGPEALSAARAGACVSERWFACRAARERARCGECGGERWGVAAHPLLPLRTRRRPEERTRRA
jgi:hypothetical protein